jgi:hypothetical protein
MFRALLAHRQEALHKRHLVYFVGPMSVGCTTIKVEVRSTSILVKVERSSTLRVLLSS